MPGPLSHIRVLDLSRVLAGPSCAKAFAEHGADVMRITRRDLPDLGAPSDVDTGIGLGRVECNIDFGSLCVLWHIRELDCRAVDQLEEFADRGGLIIPRCPIRLFAEINCVHRQNSGAALAITGAIRGIEERP